MKELMWKYLCLRFPNVYRRKTKFGIAVYYNYHDTFDIQKTEILDNMMSMFSCSKEEALIVLNEWTDSINFLGEFTYSTNPDVLISLIN